MIATFVASQRRAFQLSATARSTIMAAARTWNSLPPDVTSSANVQTSPHDSSVRSRSCFACARQFSSRDSLSSLASFLRPACQIVLYCCAHYIIVVIVSLLLWTSQALYWQKDLINLLTDMVIRILGQLCVIPPSCLVKCSS